MNPVQILIRPFMHQQTSFKLWDKTGNVISNLKTSQSETFSCRFLPLFTGNKRTCLKLTQRAGACLKTSQIIQFVISPACWKVFFAVNSASVGAAADGFDLCFISESSFLHRFTLRCCFFSFVRLHTASSALTSASPPPAVVSQRPLGHRAPSSPLAPPPQESPQTAAEYLLRFFLWLRREAPRGFASLPPQASEIPETP